MAIITKRTGERPGDKTLIRKHTYASGSMRKHGRDVAERIDPAIAAANETIGPSTRKPIIVRRNGRVIAAYFGRNARIFES